MNNLITTCSDDTGHRIVVCITYPASTPSVANQVANYAVATAMGLVALLVLWILIDLARGKWGRHRDGSQ